MNLRRFAPFRGGKTEHVPEDSAWREQKTEKPSARFFLFHSARSAARSSVFSVLSNSYPLKAGECACLRGAASMLIS
ncbi:MAG: hypothetical protein LBD06_10170 [Candidatus Accumulibacter sp.]|nr:hypothetical protein [Accumulibacter sp.]